MSLKFIAGMQEQIKRVPQQLKIYLSKSTCIYHNLAFEDWLFRNHDLQNQGDAVLLWSNKPAVVFGRHQNPWMEVDLEFVRSRGIDLVRRYSGGGAVYHDEGNLNLSFLTTQKDYHRLRNLVNVCNWLQAEFPHLTLKCNSRDDINLYPGNRKISGTAARIAHGRAYHHFTLLVKPDMNALRRSLVSPLNTSIHTNATPSTRADAVGFLAEELGDTVDVPVVRNVLMHGLIKSSPHCSVHKINPEYIDDKETRTKLKLTVDELRSDDHIFNRTPRFTVMLNNSKNYRPQSIEVEHGRVVKSSNFLYPVGALFHAIKCS